MNFISILMPVYNGEDYMEEAIDSIEQQGYPNYELIISVDQSKDRSYEIAMERSIKNPKIRVHHNTPGNGQVSNWNGGIDLCSGDWIQFFCHDDLMLPGALDYIDKLIQYSKQKSDVGLIGHGAAWLFSNGIAYIPEYAKDGGCHFENKYFQRDIQPQEFDPAKVSFYNAGKISSVPMADLLRRPLPAMTTAVVNKKKFMEFGKFNTSQVVHFDVYTWMLFNLQYGMIQSQVPLTLTRVHGNQVSSLSRNKEDNTLKEYYGIWDDYKIHLSKFRPIDSFSNLFIKAKPLSSKASLISVELIKGNYRNAGRLLLKNPGFSTLLVSLFVLRSLPKELNRVRHIAKKVPYSAIYP